MIPTHEHFLDKIVCELIVQRNQETDLNKVTKLEWSLGILLKACY